MKKKVLAVLLGGCMVVGMLAGCGGGGDDAKKDGKDAAGCYYIKMSKEDKKV